MSNFESEAKEARENNEVVWKDALAKHPKENTPEERQNRFRSRFVLHTKVGREERFYPCEQPNLFRATLYEAFPRAKSENTEVQIYDTRTWMLEKTVNPNDEPPIEEKE